MVTAVIELRHIIAFLGEPIADLGIYRPDISAHSAIAIAIDTRSEFGINATDEMHKLCGLFGQQQIAAIGKKLLESCNRCFI